MKLFGKIIVSLGAVVLLLPLGYHLTLRTLPKINLWHPNETLIIGENTEDGSVAVHNGTAERYLELDEIRPEIVSYLIGLEDQNFYKHHGVDYKRIFKSAFDNITSGKIVSGGSTITQQLARLLFLNNDKTYTRKIKEYNYARRLEFSLTKTQILEAYLNSAYFGKNLYGLENASRFYYAKDAWNLADNEAISLFALLKSPNSLAPDNDRERFEKCYRDAVYALYERDVINVDKYYELYQQIPIVADSPADDPANEILYYYDGIKRDLKATGKRSDLVGKTVYTTIDQDLQKSILDIIGSIKNPDSPENVAVVVMRPQDGACLALIGGSSPDHDGFNRALDGVTQLGSTVKPLLYTIALEKGFTPLTELKSAPTVFHIDGVGDYAPQNSTGTYAEKNITMVEALALSDNIYATKTTLLLGSSAISRKLSLVGIEGIEDSVTNGLGSFSLSPLTLTSLYNALANRGVYHRPYFVKSVKEKTKTVFTKSTDAGIRIFESEKALLMSHMLLAPYDPAFQTYAKPTMLGYEPNSRFAVKTGSTESSSLVMAYNPNFTLGIYTGTDDNSPDFDKSLAKRLFVPIANRLMEGKKDSFYESTDFKAFTLTNVESKIKSKVYYR